MTATFIVVTACFVFQIKAIGMETAAPSPKQVLEQRIGLTDFKIDYSRPSVKERKIFGDLVPYNSYWRTGANAPTRLSISRAATIGGVDVPAGEYSLFSIPGKTNWTIIISNMKNLPGKDGVDAKEDVARFDVSPTQLKDQVESFTIGFDELRNDTATMFLDWDHTRVSIPIELNTREQVIKSVSDAMASETDLKPWQYGTAAEAFFEYDYQLDKALEWIQVAVEKQPNAFWWIHTQAQVLAKLGHKSDAIAAARQSIEAAKNFEQGDFGYIKRNQDFIDSLN